MESYLFGFVCALALVGFVFFRFASIDQRDALAKQLFGWFTKPQPEPQPEPYVPPPAPPLRPPVRYGNILPVEAESDRADAPDIFEFPEAYEATLPYEDFNRRLIVFNIAPASEGRFPIYPTRISDEPVRIHGSSIYLNRIIKEQFRPVYPVLLDTTGIFAAISARLEWDPLFMSPHSQVLLAIPEQSRPVVISVTNAAQHQTKARLTFIRYGFEDYPFDPSFLTTRGRLDVKSLTVLFDRFLGPADLWMWFSRARLQYEIVSGDRASATLAQKLREDAERERLEVQKLEQDDSYENFAELFGIANPLTPETTT